MSISRAKGLIHTKTNVISTKPKLFQCKHKRQCTYKHICCTFHLNIKGNFHPITDHEGPEVEQRDSSTLSLTSALDRMGGQRHAPAALPPGKTRYPLYSGLGGPQGRSGRVQKISPPTRIRSPNRPARSEKLYRLSKSGPFHLNMQCLIHYTCLMNNYNTLQV